MGINGITENHWGKWVDLYVELIGGGGTFPIKIWMTGNIWKMEQWGADTASCISTT
jgi:hypothetical protein